MVRIIFAGFALGLSIAPTLALRDRNEHQTTELIPRGGMVSLPQSPNTGFGSVTPVIHPIHSIETEDNLQAEQRRYRTQQSFDRTQSLKRMQLSRAASYHGPANSKNDAPHRQDARHPLQQLPPSIGPQQSSTARASASGDDPDNASSWEEEGTGEGHVTGSSGRRPGKRVEVGGRRGFRVATVRTPVFRTSAAAGGA